MFDKKKLIRYIVIFGTILFFYMIVWFIKIYNNIKSADKMLNVTLNVISKIEISDELEVFNISPKGKVRSFLKDNDNRRYYVNYGAYINEIRLVIDSRIISEINILKFEIDKKFYEFNWGDLKNRYKTENGKPVITLEANDFIGIRKSIIPVFSNLINWPGGYSFFYVNYIILVFIIILIIGIITFIIEALFIKYLPLIANNKIFCTIINILIPAMIFNLTYIQRYIYRSNQHTKFTHGLAKAGYGFLKNDWFANTIDPLPAFSFLVTTTYKYLHEYFFYFYQSILYGIFICSILGIVFTIFNIKDSKLKILTFFSTIILFHSQFIHELSENTFGISILQMFFEYGVAQQYLLGTVLQPCVFGVFILTSIYYFLNNKPYIAVILSAIASIFHTGYILFSGLLTLSYLLIIFKDERNLKKAFFVGMLSLILVTPVLFYNNTFLKSTSSEEIKTAYDIIVNKRIPFHTNPKVWINYAVFIKVIIISIAIFIARKKKIFIILLLPYLTGVILTIIKLLTNSTFIGFLTPWRVSVFLVPLSTVIILAYSIDYFFNKFGHLLYKKEFLIRMINYVVILIPVLFGLYLLTERFDYYLNKKMEPIEHFVYKNKSPNDNYLIPTDFMEFRLNTGAPVFITKKSHPYKDLEIIEWDRRVNIADEFYYTANNPEKSKIILLLKRNYGITHVVLLKNQFDWNLECLEEIYRDSYNGVYKIKE